MTAENSVSFKVFLLQNGVEPEIRRFTVSRDVVTSYIYLKQKLETVFPSLREHPFIISWRDREGDQVQIWSDEELIIALTEIEDECKKLYVIPGQTPCHPQTPKGDNLTVINELSTRSIIDHFISFAMQVFICFFSALQHFLNMLEKIMLPPIIKKLDYSIQRRMNRMENDIGTSDYLDSQNNSKIVHYGVTCDGCEKDVIGFRYKCAYCPDYDLCQDCETKKIHGHHYMVRIPVPVNKDVEFGRKMMREFFKFNRHASKPERECKRGGGYHKRAGSCYNQFIQPPQCTSNSGAHEEPSAPSHSRSFFEQGLPINVEGIIESVMQGLLRMAGAEFADPPTKETSSAQVPSPTQAQSPSTAPAQNQTQAGEPAATTSTSTLVLEPIRLVPNVQNSNNSTQDVRGAEAVIPLPQPPVTKPTVSTEGMQGPNFGLTDPWHNRGDLYPTPQIQPHMSLFTPVQQPNSSSNQAKIEESLNRMLSMGFNNEGDFLRQILISKNGDMDQVLDMLLPLQSRKNL